MSVDAQPATRRRERFCYTVRDVDETLLSGELLVLGAAPLPVRLRFISARGLRLHLDPVLALLAPPAVGDTLRLRLRSSLLSEPLELGCRCTESESGEDGLEIGVVFEEWSQPIAELPAPLRAVLNSRRVERSVLRRTERVDVKLSLSNRPLPLRAELTDFSMDGIGMHLPGRQMRHLHVGQDVGVRFVMTALKETIQTTLEIRHLEDQQRGARVGGRFHFDRGDSLRLKRKFNALALRRKREQG